MKDKTKLIISLLKLVRPFFMIMLLAIILGVLGHYFTKSENDKNGNKGCC